MNKIEHEKLVQDAENGSVDALYQLGVIKFSGAYIKGIGFIEQDLVEASKLFQAAATCGNVEAQKQLRILNDGKIDSFLASKERIRLDNKTNFLIKHSRPSIIEDIEGAYSKIKSREEKKESRADLNISQDSFSRGDGTMACIRTPLDSTLNNHRLKPVG